MTAETRLEIDKLLSKIASLECNLGKDSTKQEKLICKIKQKELASKIKTLDIEFYKTAFYESE